MTCNYHLNLKMNCHIVKSHIIYRTQIGFLGKSISIKTALEIIIKCGFRRKNNHTRQNKVFVSQWMSSMVFKFFFFFRLMNCNVTLSISTIIILFTVNTTLKSWYKFDLTNFKWPVGKFRWIVASMNCALHCFDCEL